MYFNHVFYSHPQKLIKPVFNNQSKANNSKSRIIFCYYQPEDDTVKKCRIKKETFAQKSLQFEII
jgi:hypothetical protein